ncbi:MAG: hypothetical protein M3Y87_08105, partial [Myxococcota bacterium]|nr:hypothetical protein [Myxococcota bacterium]
AAGDAVAGIARPTWRRAGEDALAPALEASMLDYPHVPERSVLLPARTRLVPVALRSLAGQRWRVGYVEGTGDEVASSLTEAGMDVVPLELASLGGDLSGYDAIVVGVRAFNRWPELDARHAALMAYVERGGTLIVQYQTVNRLESLRGPIGPAPLTIGRGRVTDQNAAVELLAPEHPALRTPHEIGPADFEGWVQERGLYFAESWDAAYTPLLRIADPGEEPADGALLVAAHGEGHFVYAGLSFFRQLPAGTAGAYRLFENLVALGTPSSQASSSDVAITAPLRATPDARAIDEQDPPPFGTWRGIYLGVAWLLVGFMVLFFWLSRRFG